MSGLFDLHVINTVCTIIIFTDILQKKLAAARQEEKKQSRVTGKFHLKYFCCQKFLTCRASG